MIFVGAGVTPLLAGASFSLIYIMLGAYTKGCAKLSTLGFSYATTYGLFPWSIFIIHYIGKWSNPNCNKEGCTYPFDGIVQIFGFISAITWALAGNPPDESAINPQSKLNSFFVYQNRQ